MSTKRKPVTWKREYIKGDHRYRALPTTLEEMAKAALPNGFAKAPPIFEGRYLYCRWISKTCEWTEPQEVTVQIGKQGTSVYYPDGRRVRLTHVHRAGYTAWKRLE